MKKLLIIALALLSVSIVRADEGMWLLSKLKPLNIEKMQQMGFKLTAEDIYDVNKPGIKDAIVGLGNAGRPFRHFSLWVDADQSSLWFQCYPISFFCRARLSGRWFLGLQNGR